MTTTTTPRVAPEREVVLKPDDLVLLRHDRLGGVPLARLVSVEFGADGEPRAYFVRTLNALPDSEPLAIDAREVVQIFCGALER